MKEIDAIAEVVTALREITVLPPGAERAARVLRLAEDPALQALVAQEETVVLSLQGLAFAT